MQPCVFELPKVLHRAAEYVSASKVLSEAEVIEAETKALQRHALELVDPEAINIVSRPEINSANRIYANGQKRI